MKTILAIIALLGIPLIAFAQASSIPVFPSDATGVIAWFQATHAAGNWSLLIGGVITLFVRMLTLLKPLADKLPAESAKYIAMALAVLGSVATGLLAGTAWYKVLLDGIEVGMTAIGGWELVLKPVLDKLGIGSNTPSPAK